MITLFGSLSDSWTHYSHGLVIILLESSDAVKRFSVCSYSDSPRPKLAALGSIALSTNLLAGVHVIIKIATGFSSALALFFAGFILAALSAQSS